MTSGGCKRWLRLQRSFLAYISFDCSNIVAGSWIQLSYIIVIHRAIMRYVHAPLNGMPAVYQVCLQRTTPMLAAPG